VQSVLCGKETLSHMAEKNSKLWNCRKYWN